MSKTNESTGAAPVSLLEQFQGLGLFASKDVHPDTIKLPDGKVAEFYVRELPDADFRRIWADGDRAKLIAATICDADGKAVMTESQAAQLKPLVAVELQGAAMRHSGFGDKAEAASAEAGNG